MDPALFDSYETPAELLGIFERLDALASENLQQFIQDLVRILADTKQPVHRRVGAAKEIKRHLGSEYEFDLEEQKQEWLKIEQVERNSIQTKLCESFGSLNSLELIDPLVEAVSSIIILDGVHENVAFGYLCLNFDHFTDYGKIAGITIFDKILTLMPYLYSDYQTQLMDVLRSTLREATNLTLEDLNNKRFHAAMLCTTHHLKILPNDFIQEIVQTIEQKELLVSNKEEVFVAAVTLLTEGVIQMQKKKGAEYSERYWREKMKGGIRRRLAVKKLEMPSVSIVIDKFYEALKSILNTS